MEVSVAASMAAAIPATPRFINPVSFTPSFPLTRSKIFDLYPNPRNRKALIFVTRCSTKPKSDRDNETGKNSIVEPNSDNPEFNLHIPATPTSNQSSSSPNSCFSRGLVLDLGSDGSWDSLEIGSPVVKRFLSDDEERWYMWYHGRSGRDSGSDSIGLAVSSNGIHWERGEGQVQSSGDVGLVINCSKDWWAFDTHGIMPSEVLVMSSSKIRASSAVYWLYYTGFSPEKVEVVNNPLEVGLENPERVDFDFDQDRNDVDENSGGTVYKSFPGLAMSQDGRHWARIEGEHHSGALFDVGADGEWDSMFIASPQVVFHDSGDLRMYYHSFDMAKGHFAIGMARSRDGMRWMKLGKIMGGGVIGSFDEYGLVNPCVVRNKRDGKYLMVYEGVGSHGRRSIGMAESLDGLKDWRRVEEGQVLKWSEDGWDDKEVGSPCLVLMDGEENEWRLYYRGIGKGGKTGIGMAVSEGKDARKFRRWAGFHLLQAIRG